MTGSADVAHIQAAFDAVELIVTRLADITAQEASAHPEDLAAVASEKLLAVDALGTAWHALDQTVKQHHLAVDLRALIQSNSEAGQRLQAVLEQLRQVAADNTVHGKLIQSQLLFARAVARAAFPDQTSTPGLGDRKMFGDDNVNLGRSIGEA